MKITRRIFQCILLAAVLLTSCSYQRHVTVMPTGLPEQVYLSPQVNSYGMSRVGVFRFAEPSYGHKVGEAAAMAIYNELLKRDVFLNVIDQTGRPCVEMRDTVNFARHKGYDLIIMGYVLYYFEGSAVQPSRVDEQIKVVYVPTGEILWYAMAVDVVSSALSTDFFVLKGKNDTAPGLTVLLQRNAEKFCRMLYELPLQISVDKDKDSDLDGVCDRVDRCPGTAEGLVVDMTGCLMDSDSDGVFDYLDRCPGTPKGARVNDRGCWALYGVYFDIGKWDIEPQAYPGLLEISAVLDEQPDLEVEIEGHTDSTGSLAFNQTLSENRARAVMEYLIKRGISPERLSVMGYAFSRPVVPNDTEQGRAKNRRVELRPTPNKSP